MKINIVKGFNQFYRKAVNIKIIIKNIYFLLKASVAKRALGLWISFINRSDVEISSRPQPVEEEEAR